LQTNIYSRFFFSGDFLPPQIIYGGKTERCHPVYKFRQHFNNEYFLIKICICGRNLRFNASLRFCQKFFLHHLVSIIKFYQWLNFLLHFLVKYFYVPSMQIIGILHKFRKHYKRQVKFDFGLEHLFLFWRYDRFSENYTFLRFPFNNLTNHLKYCMAGYFRGCKIWRLESKRYTKNFGVLKFGGC
jgi:hypothetical protein